jgi:hypothetical protein
MSWNDLHSDTVLSYFRVKTSATGSDSSDSTRKISTFESSTTQGQRREVMPDGGRRMKARSRVNKIHHSDWSRLRRCGGDDRYFWTVLGARCLESIFVLTVSKTGNINLARRI